MHDIICVMRILILGSDEAAKKFFTYFSELDKNNIVFSTAKDCGYVEFDGVDDVVEFVCANEINFVLITDEEYINQGISEILSARNISVFSPSIDAIELCVSRNNAKRFMHKNKIPTSRFQIFEKPNAAIDYIKAMTHPYAIKPDFKSYQEGSRFFETFKQGQDMINDLFSKGNKKIIIEDYIEGKNVSVWVLSDGYSAKILGTSAKYQNDIAYFEPEFLSEEIKEKMFNNAILPTIHAMSENGEEYIGILGFDFMLDRFNNFYLVNYNSFFDDINVDFYTKGFDINWLDVFESTIVGDVFLKFDFNEAKKNNYMLTIRDNEKIHFIEAKRKSTLELYLDELSLNKEIYDEAQKVWNY